MIAKDLSVYINDNENEETKAEEKMAEIVSAVALLFDLNFQNFVSN